MKTLSLDTLRPQLSPSSSSSSSSSSSPLIWLQRALSLRNPIIWRVCISKNLR
jgi:hypothetical protein